MWRDTTAEKSGDSLLRKRRKLRKQTKIFIATLLQPKKSDYLTNNNINGNNQQGDSEEESCESSFKDTKDYEMEDDEKFPEIN